MTLFKGKGKRLLEIHEPTKTMSVSAHHQSSLAFQQSNGGTALLSLRMQVWPPAPGYMAVLKQ